MPGKAYVRIIVLMTASLALVTLLISLFIPGKPATQPAEAFYWIPPDTAFVHSRPDAGLILYGRELIRNTSYYLGPNGTVAKTTNGMNCQNCHLDAGTRAWGNNYGAVASLYPKFRDRSGTIETIYKRVNDCFQRSLNSPQPLDSNSKEMKAIEAYLQWVGSNVPKKVKPAESGIEDIAFIDRAADTLKGHELYLARCRQCHGADGQGQLNPQNTGYLFPPLWGENSYTSGAGLYRVSRLAGYIRNNMPNGATHDHPTLTTEEAWDIAAFVNTQPRPVKVFAYDWPDVSRKPIDYPFGPYADGFSETQHKYGPFAPIAEKRKARKSARAVH